MLTEKAPIFLKELQLSSSTRTYTTYSHHLRDFLLTLDVDKEIINQDDLDNYIEILKKRKYSDPTIINYLAAIKNFCIFCEFDKDLTFRIKDYKHVVELKSKLVTKQDFELIIDNILYKSRYSENELVNLMILRDLLVLQLLIETGIKTGEFCALKIADIDLQKKQVNIKEINRPDRHFKIKDNTIRVLKSYLEERSKIHQISSDRPLLISLMGKDGLHGSSTTTRSVQRAVVNFSDGKFTPKDFRHTFTMVQLFANRGLYVTSELLGGISDDTKSYYRSLLENMGDKIQMNEKDYDTFEYLRSKHRKSKLFELISTRKIIF